MVIPKSFLQKWWRELHVQSPSSGRVIFARPATLGWYVFSRLFGSLGKLRVISSCCSLANSNVRRVVIRMVVSTMLSNDSWHKLLILSVE